MTPTSDRLPSNYRFADLTLDAARRSVVRDGQPIELKALDFDLLRFLVEQAPNVVNADVLAEKVWGRHFVSPENVAQRVMLLRQSLSDDANKPRYIETVRNKGYRLIPLVESVPVEVPRAAPHRGWSVSATVIVLIAALSFSAGAAYWLSGTTKPPSPSSVAVLPFENLSPDPDDAYFAISMQDVIVSQLTKIRGLRVFPVRPGGGQSSIRNIGRDLNVVTVLGGSVYAAGERIRVTPRLSLVASGVSLWSDSYERERRDVLAIQSDIALDVAQALRLELTVGERERVEQVPTTNPRARDLYLRARARDPTVREEMLRALAEVDEVLALDPQFKEALVFEAGIRNGYAQVIDQEHLEEHRRHGEQSVRRALALDPEFAEGHAVLGLFLHTQGDWSGAEDAFRKAQSLNVPWARLAPYAFLRLSVGKLDGLAIDIFESARAADPANPLFYRFLAFLHEARDERSRANDFYENGASLFRGDRREALAMLEQRMHWHVARGEVTEARAMTMADPLNSAMLAILDSPDRALTELRRVYDASLPGNVNLRRTVALWAGHFGDPVLALTAMRAATNEVASQAAPYLWMPQLSEMRRLPEFKTYVRDIGLVAYWRKYGWPDQFCRPLGERDFECR